MNLGKKSHFQICSGYPPDEMLSNEFLKRNDLLEPWQCFVGLSTRGLSITLVMHFAE